MRVDHRYRASGVSGNERRDRAEQHRLEPAATAGAHALADQPRCSPPSTRRRLHLRSVRHSRAGSFASRNDGSRGRRRIARRLDRDPLFRTDVAGDHGRRHACTTSNSAPWHSASAIAQSNAAAAAFELSTPTTIRRRCGRSRPRTTITGHELRRAPVRIIEPSSQRPTPRPDSIRRRSVSSALDPASSKGVSADPDACSASSTAEFRMSTPYRLRWRRASC